MQFVDANIILRYIMNDHAELSPKAKKIIGENVMETPIEVLCEVVFVLARVYKVNRKEIADTLIEFYSNTNCVLPHREAVIRGVEYYGEKNLDFVDCILAGYCEKEEIVVHTLDNKLEKLLLTIQQASRQEEK